METFALRGLSFTYPGQSRPALDDITLTVRSGDFLVLCGPSGCGKTTLLRQFKTVLTPHGRRAGEIWFEGRPLDDYGQRAQSGKIGFVLQSPENQIVTDKVWHELAFGLESLGCDTPTIRRRVAEMASFFGIQSWFYRDVTSLSGGQKQLLNLAAVMAMQPSVLILDEPTSQLDPIAAGDFLATVGKINRELGTTVILTEHRLEDVFPLATQVAVMDSGRLTTVGSPRDAGLALRDAGHAMFLAMPTPMRVWAASETDPAVPCPITVREGRDWLTRYGERRPLRPLPEEPPRNSSGENVVSCRGLWFRYEKNSPDVLKNLSLEVKKGELLALLGGNGTGKSTLLKLLAGLETPLRGELHVRGRLGVLPQNPQALFVKKTVREDLYELFRGQNLPQEEQDARVSYVAGLCRLTSLLDRHPYDLSGGEQQRAALAKVLLLEPDVLLMDEPTKGLDGEFKQTLGEIMRALLARGAAVLMVSHDIEFCAEHAHRCALLFDGDVVTQGAPRAFFSGNSFYTTSANRMARALEPRAVTAEDVIALCGGDPPAPPTLPKSPSPPPPSSSPSPSPSSPSEGSGLHSKKPDKLPWWRKLLGLLFGGVALAVPAQFLGLTDISPLWNALGLTNRASRQFWLYVLFTVSLFLCVSCFSRRGSRPGVPSPPPQPRRKLPRRTVLSAAMALLLVPLTLFVGEAYLGGGKYTFIMLLVLLECMLPFFLVFEGRKPQARELVVIAVLCALGVAGRAALFMLPQFKPVLALVIISGAAFGGETGFLVGAVTMLASNMLFRQGPYTPWQMFAAGMVGFLAGILFHRGLLRRTRLSLCVFGAAAAVLCYGGIMNFQSALQASPGVLNPGVLLSYYATGFPMDCIHAAATWFFLWVAAEPMLEKLDRLNTKYALMT